MVHFLFLKTDDGLGGIYLWQSSGRELNLAVGEKKRNNVAVVSVDEAVKLRDALTKWIEEQKGE